MSDQKVEIVEVGPRDGLQNEKKILSLDVKLKLFELLVKAGLRTIEPTSFVREDKIPQMADSSSLYNTLSQYKDIRMPALVPNQKGFENALNSNVKCIAIFTATSDTFNMKNTNATFSQSIERFKEFVPKALDMGIEVRAYISTVFGCPYEGHTSIDKLLMASEELFKLGAYEISYGDTIGVANPWQVKNVITKLKQNFDLSKMAMHFHDTEGLALANIYSSFEEGIRIFDSSVAGLGGCPYAKGATGNVATDDVVNMFDKMNIQTGVDADKLHLASQYITTELERESVSKYFQAKKGRCS